jgi:hypothetical protein
VRGEGGSARRAVVVQRVENGLLAVLALVAAIWLYPAWWWVVLAAFLVFDLSMLGYARSAAAGAVVYNAVHSYAGPAVLGAAAVVATAAGASAATVVGVAACAWGLHVGVDRALGYGLKLDAFTHTHLGLIGQARAAARSRGAETG